MKDLGRAFSFPFKDPRWPSKLIIASLCVILSLLLVGVFFLVGYLVQTTQRVMRKEEHALPEWKDLGRMFLLGAKFILVYLLYLLPPFILLLPVLALSFASTASESPDVFGALSVVYAFGMTLLLIPYTLALSALLPIIIYRFAEREYIRDALDVSAVVREFRANWQNTLVVALLAVGIQSFASVGIVILLIGVIFTIMYSYLVSAYLTGMLYLERRQAGRVT